MVFAVSSMLDIKSSFFMVFIKIFDGLNLFNFVSSQSYDLLELNQWQKITTINEQEPRFA